MTTSYSFQLKEIFDIIINSSDQYIFINGHPIDRRSKKYKLYYYWFDLNKLHCFSCLKEATHFKLLKTRGDGSIYKKTNKRKYTLKLYSNDNTVFTFDHWYPRWFLKDNNLTNHRSNQVPMCYECNQEKWGKLPFAGRYNKMFYIPFLGENI